MKRWDSQEAAAPNAPALFSRCDACSMALSGKAACLCAAAVHWPYPDPLRGTAWGCSLPHACQKGPTVTLSLWAVFGKAYICGVNCLMVSCAPEFQIHHQFGKKDSSPSSPQSVTAACTTSLPLWPDRSALQASQVSSSCLSLFPVPVFIQKDLRSLSTPWCNPEHCKLLTQLFLKLTF